MAAPPMWPAQAAVRLPSQQQPNVAEAAQHTQHYQQWQAEQQWPPPSQRQNRQQPAVSAPSTARSGNLSRQPSGEQTSRRSQNSRQQPRQQP
ncbi:g241 [Coccomyxa viridis]|uniref:G241 protein n=1 Tax=Coccomyxa viridis TaxID=1274662 RepID=A0ABP1FIX8_9CHLO